MPDTLILFLGIILALFIGFKIFKTIVKVILFLILIIIGFFIIQTVIDGTILIGLESRI